MSTVVQVKNDVQVREYCTFKFHNSVLMKWRFISPLQPSHDDHFQPGFAVYGPNVVFRQLDRYGGIIVL